MANLKNNGTIDPSKDTIIIGGALVVGLTEDDAVSLVRDEDITDTYNGQDDSYTISVIRNSRGTLTIRLQETSETNQLFWGYLGVIQGGGFTVLPWAINRGTTVIGGGTCWLQGQPEVVLGRTAKEYEWTFRVDDANLNLAVAGSSLSNITGGTA